MRRIAILSVCMACTAPARGGDVRFMEKADEDRLWSFVPAEVAKVFPSRPAIYTEEEVPRAYQHGGGVHSAWYNIAARPDPFGNASREFPWSTPFGLSRPDNVRGFKMVYLPSAIEWWQERGRIAWSYPAGTKFGELLTVVDDEDKDHTFEVRIRTKGDDGRWQPTVFRPDIHAEDVTVVSRRESRLWNRHPVTIIDRTGIEQELAPMETNRVRRLLARPFVRVREPDTAYTVRTGFSIVPRGYEGHFFPVNQRACMTCHETAGRQAREFDGPREWYGDVRGANDGILSFHPFDKSCISSNGFTLRPVFRGDLVQAGMLKRRGE